MKWATKHVRWIVASLSADADGGNSSELLVPAGDSSSSPLAVRVAVLQYKSVYAPYKCEHGRVYVRKRRD